MHRVTTAPVAPIPARTRWAVAAGAGAALAAVWWLGDTAPYPYAQRGLLDVLLPFLTADRMDAVLRPRPGERILEIGPGTGLQSPHGGQPRKPRRPHEVGGESGGFRCVNPVIDCAGLLSFSGSGGADQAEIGEFLRHELEDHFGLTPLPSEPEATAARVMS
ncbi:hypothetical protein [Streptomyces sp. NPDC001975]